jgi:hypothetical protein
MKSSLNYVQKRSYGMLLKKNVFIFAVFTVVVVVTLCLILLYQRECPIPTHRGFSNASSSLSRITFQTDNGTCHAIVGIVRTGESTIAQPMVIFFEKDHSMPNVATGWEYERDTANGLVTVNGRTIKVPLGSVILINSENNRLKMLSNSWDISLYGKKEQIESYIKNLLKLQ